MIDVSIVFQILNMIIDKNFRVKDNQPVHRPSFFLFKVRRARRGDLSTAGARGRGSKGEHFSFSRFTLAAVFEKNEKKDRQCLCTG